MDVDDPCEVGRLLAHDADAPAIQTAKADDDVGCERALDVQKLAVVHDALDDIEHVIGARGLLRNDRAEGLVDSLRVIALVGDRWVVQVVEREVAEEEPDGLHALFLGIQREVRHAGELRMRVRAAELLVRDLFPGDGLDDVRSGDEHLRDAPHHEREIGDGRGVDRASGRRPQDG